MSHLHVSLCVFGSCPENPHTIESGIFIANVWLVNDMSMWHQLCSYSLGKGRAKNRKLTTEILI